MRCLVPSACVLACVLVSGAVMAQSPGDLIPLPDGGAIYHIDPGGVATAEGLLPGETGIGGLAPIVSLPETTEVAPILDSGTSGGVVMPEPGTVALLFTAALCGLVMTAVRARKARRSV
jgi:hypothetical protein